MLPKILLMLSMSLILNLAETHRLKFTKIFCNNTDEDFATIQSCQVKAVSRHVQFYQLYIKFHQLPITDFELRYHVLKRANGYKPFLYDFKVTCDFIKHLNPVKGIVWNWVKDVSNLNHSCPLTEDFEIKRLENLYIQKTLQSLPIPDGDYALYIHCKIHNKLRMILQFFVTIDQHN